MPVKQAGESEMAMASVTWSQWIQIIVLAAMMVPGVGRWAYGSELTPVSGSILELDRADGWNLGARIQLDRRKLLLPENADLDIEALHGVVRLGAQILPFLHLWTEAGTVRADRVDADGSAGLVWAVGGGATLFQYHIRRSPVFGGLETIGIALEGSYRVARSSLPHGPDSEAADTDEDLDLTWKDTRLGPVFSYRLDRRADVIWQGYEPTGYVLRAGPVYTRTTGTYGTERIREDHAFGVLFGADVRFPSGWIGRLDWLQFHPDDREVSLGIFRFF